MTRWRRQSLPRSAFVCSCVLICPFREGDTAGNTYWFRGRLRTPVSFLTSCGDTAGAVTPVDERDDNRSFFYAASGKRAQLDHIQM